MESPSLLLDPAVDNYLQQSLLQCQDASDSARYRCLLRYHATPPLYTTLRVNTLHQTTEHVQSLIQETLDTQYANKGWLRATVATHPQLADVLVIPSHVSSNIVQVEMEVMVDLACGMAVFRGADVFVQGILAANPDMAPGDTVSVYTDLDRGCSKGLMKPYIGRKVFLGNGVARCSRQQVFTSDNKMKGVGIEMTSPLYCAPSLSGLHPSTVYPQNLPSIVCSHVLAPQPGDVVMDMCAAPGGKTSHIATLMQNKGRLVALDKSSRKIPRLQSTCTSLGVTNVEFYAADGTKVINNDAASEGPPPYPSETFDRILVDAPCSALGKRPALRNPLTLAEVTSYPPLQKKLLSTAVQLLKEGGTLVYSTCSLPVEENEAMVAWILGKHSQLQLTQQVPHLGGPGFPHPGLKPEQSRLLQRFICPGIHPDTVQMDQNSSENATENDSDSALKENKSRISNVNRDTIGFFIAKFRKGS